MEAKRRGAKSYGVWVKLIGQDQRADQRGEKRQLTLNFGAGTDDWCSVWGTY